jgi:ubiquinone/menaquinone biosynthesis C-methylase UbiE
MVRMRGGVSKPADEFYAKNETDYPVLDDRLRKVLAQCERVRPSSLLDVGCGRGFFASALREKLPDVRCYGVELSPGLADQAERSGMTVFRTDVADGVPLPDDSIDLALMGEVIEHVFDPDACVLAVRRVLRPGGMLIITTPNLASWTNRVLVPLGIQPLYSETSTRKRYGRWLKVLGQGGESLQGHLRLFTLGALVEMLRDLGFTIERVLGNRFFELDRVPLANLVDAIMCARPSLASGLIVVARKA